MSGTYWLFNWSKWSCVKQQIVAVPLQIFHLLSAVVCDELAVEWKLVSPLAPTRSDVLCKTKWMTAFWRLFFQFCLFDVFNSVILEFYFTDFMFPVLANQPMGDHRFDLTQPTVGKTINVTVKSTERGQKSVLPWCGRCSYFSLLLSSSQKKWRRAICKLITFGCR